MPYQEKARFYNCLLHFHLPYAEAASQPQARYSLARKNQYENLFKSFKQKFKINDENFNKKQNEITENMKKLNTKLKNGELILITRPNNIIRISNEKNKYITYLLRGLFYSFHIIDTDELYCCY